MLLFLPAFPGSLQLLLQLWQTTEQNPNQSPCSAKISTQKKQPAKCRGLKLPAVCWSVYLALLMLFYLLKCHYMHPGGGGRNAFCNLYWIFLKSWCEKNAISCQETVISPSSMLFCIPQTTFYLPGVYMCDLLKSLAIFHNLCCSSVLAACINFSDTLSFLSKSFWKIIWGTDPWCSVFLLLHFPDRILRWQDDTAEQKSQPGRCVLSQ